MSLAINPFLTQWHFVRFFLTERREPSGISMQNAVRKTGGLRHAVVDGTGGLRHADETSVK